MPYFIICMYRINKGFLVFSSTLLGSYRIFCYPFCSSYITISFVYTQSPMATMAALRNINELGVTSMWTHWGFLITIGHQARASLRHLQHLHAGGFHTPEQARRVALLMEEGREHLEAIVFAQLDQRTHLIAIIHAMGYRHRWQGRLQGLHRWTPNAGVQLADGSFKYGEDSDGGEEEALPVPHAPSPPGSPGSPGFERGGAQMELAVVPREARFVLVGDVVPPRMPVGVRDEVKEARIVKRARWGRIRDENEEWARILIREAEERERIAQGGGPAGGGYYEAGVEEAGVVGVHVEGGREGEGEVGAGVDGAGVHGAWVVGGGGRGGGRGGVGGAGVEGGWDGGPMTRQGHNGRGEYVLSFPGGRRHFGHRHERNLREAKQDAYKLFLASQGKLGSHKPLLLLYLLMSFSSQLTFHYKLSV